MTPRFVKPGDVRIVDLERRTNLFLEARTVGLILWCSFLAAGVATMPVFALLDPTEILAGLVPAWLMSRLAIYTLGFFFLWVVCALSSALTLFMVRTERRAS